MIQFNEIKNILIPNNFYKQYNISVVQTIAVTSLIYIYILTNLIFKYTV